MALHLVHRPQTLNDLVGNDAIKVSIQSLITREDRPHTFLLHGASGCGKTTIARIMAKMLGCSDYDYNEFNVGNVRGIDTIRETLQNCQYSAIDGKIKVYVYDEAHRLTKDAQSALLKILEDTPSHIYFILCTTDPEQLIPTVRNRCMTFQVTTLINLQMKKLLNSVLEKERVDDFPATVLKEIIRVSNGCPRQALVILDSVIDILDEQEALDTIAVLTIGEAEVIDICRSIIGRSPWKTVRSKVKDVVAKTEPETLRHAILGYLTTIILSNDKDNDRLSELIDIFSESTFASGKAGIVNMIYLASR